MQYTVRTAFALITAIAITLGSVATYGIAVTLVSTVVIGISWWALMYRTKGQRLSVRYVVVTASVASLVLYFATFATFRLARTFPHPQGPPGRAFVAFSINPTAHAIARWMYAPLITTLPGDCTYLTFKDVRQLNQVVRDEGIVVIW